MLRSNTRRAVAIIGASVMAVSLAAGALGGPKGKGPSWKGGKKPIGTIASFEGESGALVVDLNDGTQFSGTVTEDTQIKIDHRGKPGKKGNPTTGSTEDLVAGYKVLRLKSAEAEDGSVVVEKVKVRRVQVEEPAPTCTDADGDGVDDTSGEPCPVETTTTTVPATTTTVPATTTTTVPTTTTTTP